MTRETKIGLLVGLAFIIVIGILLSDHLTSSTEPPQANISRAGENVRSSVTTPGAANAPVTASTNVPSVTPNQAVPTGTELQPKPTPVQIIGIGTPSNTNSQQPVDDASVTQNNTNTQSPSDPPISLAAPNSGTMEQSPVSPKGQSHPDGVATMLRDAAKRGGEELVPANPKPTPVPGNHPANETATPSG